VRRTVTRKTTRISEEEKAAAILACQQHIDGFLRPRFLPDIRPTEFNYPVDIIGRWRGSTYKFFQRYRSGYPHNLGEEFDAPFARLDWISPGLYDLMWHRHTGKWHRLHQGLALHQAIATLKADGLFHPV
jgi:hypothetical protein